MSGTSKLSFCNARMSKINLRYFVEISTALGFVGPTAFFCIYTTYRIIGGVAM
jgi:hypothetical protein